MSDTELPIDIEWLSAKGRLDKEKVKLLLVEAASKNRQQVVVFAARCAWRALILHILTGGYMRDHRELNRYVCGACIKACWMLWRKIIGDSVRRGQLDLSSADVLIAMEEYRNYLTPVYASEDDGKFVKSKHGGPPLRKVTHVPINFAQSVIGAIDASRDYSLTETSSVPDQAYSAFSFGLASEPSKLSVKHSRNGIVSDLKKLESNSSLIESPLFEVDLSIELSEAIDDLELPNELNAVYSALSQGNKINTQDYIELPINVFDLFLERAKLEWEEFSESKIDTELEPEIDLGDSESYVPSETVHTENPGTEDSLNRDNLARVLGTWLDKQSVEDHFSIGLFGDWGAGKSTFVNLLKKQLSIINNKIDVDGVYSYQPHDEVIYGEFNAWHYEHCQNIQAGIAQEAVNALTHGLSFWKKLRLTTEFAWNTKRNEISSIILAILASFITFLVGNSEAPSSNTANYIGLGGILASISYLLIRFRKLFAHPLAKEFKTYLRLPDFGEELGTVPVMREQIRQLCELRLRLYGKPQRLFFVVDDLDRCNTEAVVKVLEAVRLVLDVPRLIVVIAIDHKVALSALACRYEVSAKHQGVDPKAIARAYLGKVIHIPILLRDPDQFAVQNYLHENLWKGSDEAHTSFSDNGLQNSGELELKSGSTEDDSYLEVAIDENGRDDDWDDEEFNLEDFDIGDSDENEDELDKETRSSNYSDLDLKPDYENAHARIGLSSIQKRLFLSFCQQLKLVNPRHLKRLDNCYSLIRRCFPDEDLSENYPRLSMLLWLEYCRNLPNETAANFSEYARAIHLGKPDAEVQRLSEILNKNDPAVLRNWDAVKESLNMTDEERHRMYEEVLTFVLPAIESEM